jgi:ubiquitin carboxyl-terminal hydrolase 5/13
MQFLFSISSFQEYYYEEHLIHIENCYERPTECFRCQMGKLGFGLLSGRYSINSDSKGAETGIGNQGISPHMIKKIMALGNEEFSSVRQQDAQEYLQYVLTTVQKKEKQFNQDPSKPLQFSMENRLQCVDCKRVAYSTESASTLVLPVSPNENVDFQAMLESYFSVDNRDYFCPSENRKTTANVIQRFKSFPRIISFTASRFILGPNWVMEKLSVKLNVPDQICLNDYVSQGLQPGEVEFPQSICLNLI